MAHYLPPLKAAKLAKYRVWLTERGAELLQATNEFEVIRYMAGAETHVIYRNDGNTRWSPVNGAQQSLEAFLNGTRWAAPITRIRNGASISLRIYDALVLRDGDGCFYCGRYVAGYKSTLEHLVPRAHGGPNHLSNYALAHKECNAAAGALSVVEKVRLREKTLVNERMKAA